MSKRKREDNAEVARSCKGPASRDSSAQRHYLDGVLERSKQLLSQALKLAKGFERQKLGRRQKAARLAKDDGESKRLDAEVLALKALDIYPTAETHLYKSMLKTKSMLSAPAFPFFIQNDLSENSKPHDVARANVQARLFNSQPVKKAMDDSMSNIRLSLGLNDIQSSKKKRIRKADLLREKSTVNIRKTSADAGGTTIVRKVGRATDASPATEVPDREPGQTSSSNESLNYDEFDSRLAGSADELSDGDSKSIDYGELHAEPASGPVRELSSSASPEISGSSGTTDSPPPRNSRGSEKSTKDSKATTFLPSLTMGGYWSGSEPASDDEGSVGGQTRKNRRGQRERRMIAEKKYGQNAKHLRKQGQEQDRDRGWHPRKGAQTEKTDESESMKQLRRSGGSTRVPQVPRTTKQGAAASSGANSDPVGPRRRIAQSKPADGPLHPSWQAAKQAKEQKQTARFQGKKLTFD
ncbi:MAG: hypothetical protein Q9182_006099 [Xanthomendoza sp. 2 TL-2023]